MFWVGGFCGFCLFFGGVFICFCVGFCSFVCWDLGGFLQPNDDVDDDTDVLFLVDLRNTTAARGFGHGSADLDISQW